MCSEIINSDYKYTDKDINRILKIKLEKEQLVESDVKLHAPISEEKILESLKDEIIRNSNFPNRILLIPYLDGFYLDGHWIGVVVRFESGCPKKVEMYDSLGCEIPEILKNAPIAAYKTNNICVVNEKNAIKQEDSASCGPCMIENLINAAKQDFSNKPTSLEIRENHMMLMNEFYPDEEFSELQNSLTTADNLSMLFIQLDIHKGWSKYNIEGNECLSRMDIAGAIAKYELAIKSYPNSAISHYNKRLALAFQNNPEALKTVNNGHNRNNKRTGYVLSVICHIPVNSSNDFSGKDNQNDNHNENILKTTYKYTTTKPTKATGMGKPTKHAKNKLAFKYDIIGAEIPIPNDGIKKKSDTVQPFLDKLCNDKRSEPFFGTDFELIKVSIGLNRMKSVSTEKNKFLWRELESTIDTKIEYEVFGFFWPCKWYNQETGDEVDYEEVEKYYEELSSDDILSAKRFLYQEEDEFEKQPDNIPYQQLREYAKNHLKTKKLVQKLKENNVDVYLHIIDSDVINFNGIFGAYSRIIEGCYQLPTVMTTGYEYSSNGKYGQAYRLLSKMDRMYRYRTAFHLPLGTYYPEPNMCILVPDSENTVPESFVDIKRGNKLESPIIISNIQTKRKNPTFLFSEDKPLITPVPHRATIWKAPRAKISAIIEFFKGLGKDWPAVDQSDIDQFWKSSQSNSKPYNRHNNLFINSYFKINQIFKEGNMLINRNKCISIISELCKLETPPFDEYKELLNLTNKNICSQLLKVIDEWKKIPEDFNEKYKQTEEEQMALKFLRDAEIDLEPISRETVLILATESILELIPEKAVSVNDLIQLSDEALHFIVEKEEIREALENKTINNDTLFSLMNEQNCLFDDFKEAIYETGDVEEVLCLYEKNPLHLEFLKRRNHEYLLIEYVYENSDDPDIVKMGLDEYDVSYMDLRNLFTGENEQINFELLLNWIFPECSESNSIL